MLIFDKSTTIERISSLFSIPVVVKLFGFFVLIRGTSVLYKHSYGERTSQTPLQIFLDPQVPVGFMGIHNRLGIMIFWRCMSVGLASMTTKSSTRLYLEWASCLSPYLFVNQFFSVDVESGYDGFESDQSHIDG